MQSDVYPYILPVKPVEPVFIHLTDINSIDSFFIFTDAAIRSHPFVLLTSFALTLFLFYIILNSKKIYHRIYCNYSNYLYNKGGE